MTAMKLLGAVLIVLTGTAAGWQKAGQARRHTEILSRMDQLIGRIRTEIFYRGTALPDLLTILQQENLYPELHLEGCTELQSYVLPQALTKQETAALCGFFRELGSCTSEEAEQQGGYYQELCESFLSSAQAKAAQAEQLYTKLGFCCGSLAAILLL